MDDFSEKEQVEPTGDSTEESTVFSAPSEHKNKKKISSGNRGIITVILSAVIVLALVFGTLAVIKFIPEKEDENSGGDNTDNGESTPLTVFDYDKSKFDTVTVTNKNGEFVLLPDTAEAGSETEVNWYLKGRPKEKISASKTGDVVVCAAKITALIEVTNRSFEECGFNDPEVKVSVTSADIGDYYFIIGNVSFDDSSRYFYSSTDKKTYMITSDTLSSFVFTDLDLADASYVSPVKVSAKDETYTDEEGNLISFDKLEISGAKYDSPIVIIPVSEEDSNVAFAYKTVSPVARYAESDPVSEMFAVFTSGIAVSGVYSFDTDNAAQKQFGLNDPDLVLKLSVAGETFTYRFKVIDGEGCAVFGDGMDMIKKISAGSEFLKLDGSDIYNKIVYIRMLADLKNIAFSFDGNEYSFNVSQNPDDSEEMFNVRLGEKAITSEHFQNFYANFVGVALSEFSSGDNAAKADMTVKITDNNGKIQTITYARTTANTYSCFVDGKQAGRVTAAVYGKLVSDIKTVSENKDVKS